MPTIQGSIPSALPTASATGNTNTALQGKMTELGVSQLHGRLGLATSYGNVFALSTAAAGVTIPISSSTSPTFVLYNPLGSAINAELLFITIGITVVTSVASPILLAFRGSISTAQVPSSTTALATANMKLGGAASVSQGYSAATLNTAATSFLTIGQVTATNATAGDSLGPFFTTDLMGGVVLTPGSFVHVCGTAAQTSPTTITLWFAEFPV